MLGCISWTDCNTFNKTWKRGWWNGTDPGSCYLLSVDEPIMNRYPVNSLQWRHNGCNNVLNHQPHDCLLNRLFRRRSKKTSKLRVIGLCAGNSPVTGEFPAQMASHAENVSILMTYHVDRSAATKISLQWPVSVIGPVNGKLKLEGLDNSIW